MELSTLLKIIQNISILLFESFVPLLECLGRVIYPARRFGSFHHALVHHSFRGVEVQSRFDFDALY